MKKRPLLTSGLFVVVCMSLLVNLALITTLFLAGTLSKLSREKGDTKNPPTYDEQILEKGNKEKIAVIPLHGVIGNYQPNPLGDSLVEDFKLALRQAAKDPQVKAVIIDTDSPGGEVTASDVLYEAVKTFPADKPVLVYFNSIGASGAYYMACGADWIMCNNTTFTGSIGVIISTLNYRVLFGKIGLESLVFKSGKFKDMLNGARAISPEEKTYVEGLVMQSYERFLKIVADARKLDPNSLRKGPADGRILSGTDALKEKLVDQLGYIEDAYEKARELGNSPNAQVVQYIPQYHLGDLFLALQGKISRMPQNAQNTKVELQLPGQHLELKPGQLYLLPPFLAP